ncbi:XRE family transcriptional regulator [Peptoniphilus sp. KCTC 25270]|uniref:XRE family transcriptional regulator n=1 Tax=Peptoniphilus sp. KCTC 25270 TaxID=2897414 RepID=UPI001E42D557|nr:XRE family transcriptional regulator [Peptoniphilus sp. KCTC 25270]MCD1147235.1 XRE family transcriptional regulator [Peptoniphilus sp. KCTC 25270]
MFDYKIVSHLMERKGFSQTYIADEIVKLGKLKEDPFSISKAAVSRHLDGTSQPRKKYIQAYAKILGVKPEDLMTKDDIYSSTWIKVYETIQSNISAESIQSTAEDDDTYKEEIPGNWLQGDRKYFGLIASGNSMYPLFFDGDTILLQKTTSFIDKEICAVRMENGDAMLRYVWKNPRDNSIVLKAENSEYEDIIITKEDSRHFEVLGRFVELRRKNPYFTHLQNSIEG